MRPPWELLQPEIDRDDAAEASRPEVTPVPVEAATSALVLVGVNHTTAPLAVREQLAIPLSRLPEATRTLAHRPGIQEALILSTCNRVELLTVESAAAPLLDVPAIAPASTVASSHDHLARTLEFFADFFRIRPADIKPHLYQYREHDAVRHIFRVASSLDSMVVGEPQILGQVKHSWTVAREVGAIGSTADFSSTLDPLLQRAFSVAKRVRTETEIGANTVSVASIAAALARKIFGSLAGKTVLLVGAGKMSDLTARHLIAEGATTLLVCNRTEARAEKIADSLRNPAITTGVIPFDQLHEQSYRADIILTSTGAGATAGQPARHIFSPEQARTLLHRRRNRPVFFIDIAVPRDVSPSVNDVEGCFVYDIDDLQEVAAQHREGRSREAEAASAIVDSEAIRYRERLAQTPLIEAIKELQQSAEAVRQSELGRIAQRLAAVPLSPLQQAAVDALTRSLTAKLLHPQVAALRGSGSSRAEARDSKPDSVK